MYLPDLFARLRHLLVPILFLEVHYPNKIVLYKRELPILEHKESLEISFPIVCDCTWISGALPLVFVALHRRDEL